MVLRKSAGVFGPDPSAASAIPIGWLLFKNDLTTNLECVQVTDCRQDTGPLALEPLDYRTHGLGGSLDCCEERKYFGGSLRHGEEQMMKSGG
jgi:hypothetical protein